MKRLRNILFLLACIISLPATMAQNTSTQGKEFWLSFMHNGYRDHTQGGWIINQVLISAKRDCNGTVTNPLTGWSHPFSVRANSITTVEIPEAQGYHDQFNYEAISQKGIKVEASDTISVYCTNIAHVSFDASFVLPTESLGDEYIIQSYDQSKTIYANAYVTNNETSSFLIVATEDNTEIAITPTVNTLGGHLAGETFTITMNAGETYLVRSTRTGDQRDLSGTRILTGDCKRIAVFNGNTLTCIPTSLEDGYDHVFEQAMPLHSWGKSFVVTSSRNRNRDFIKITSSADHNQVTMNGEPLIMLAAGQSYTFPMLESEGSCFLESNQPCAVYLFNNSSYDQNPGGGQGDPSMVWIAPVEQRINDVTFSTFDHPNINIEVHSVNIIVNTEDIAHVYFDGEQISPLMFTRVHGNNEYSYTRMDIIHGVHRITCANGFNAHVYGFGHAKGYAYLVGSNAINLSSSMTLNNEVVLPDETFLYCVDAPITFNVEVNLPDYELVWDFGDGTTSTSNQVTHTFNERRVYDVSLAITSTEGGCSGSSSNTTHFFVDTRQQYVVENDEVCAGGLYSGFGFSNVLIHNDTLLTRLQDNPLHPECQDSLLLYITARPSYHIPINDGRCWQGTPGIYDGYGFSFQYDHPGVYDRQLYLQSVYGCDSVINLHLVVDDQINVEFEHHECGSSYVWNGQTYTAPGVYEQSFVSIGGCDSVVTLHLTMGQPQQTSFDTITCGTFHWNGQEYSQSGNYQQHFLTIDGCDSLVDCHLTISGNVEGATTNISTCDSYYWIDTDYTLSGLYDKTLYTSLGCDSVVHLNLHLDYTPDPAEIYPVDPENTAPHWVITATEFQINAYDFMIWDNNPYCSWDSITWAFEDPEVYWVLEPDTTTTPVGKRCKMYVLNQMEDTIWLRTTVYNACKPEGVSQRYWFVCSFYGIDEDGPSTGSGTLGTFDVVPNPNNGEMTLHFSHLIGKHEVRIYDMRGTLIDQFQTSNTSDHYTLPYHFKTLTSGIYCFVVTGKSGTLTRKVIIH